MGTLRLPRFNSPRRALCTCPPKYNLNPYLGRCSHGCLYCYAVKFPSFNGPVRAKRNLAETVSFMAHKTRPILPVMLSDCTDPYQPIEKELLLTRKCLQALVSEGFPILVVTKSDMVTRDIDILAAGRSVISITITTLREELAEWLEPEAPSPERRLSALQRLASEGLTTTCRVDPLIPSLNDNPEDFNRLISALSSMGVKHVTISTLKPVRGFFSRLGSIDPELSKRLKETYSLGETVMGYRYLPKPMRTGIVEKLMPIVKMHGLTFASCREGMSKFNSSTCDGTGYLRNIFWET